MIKRKTILALVLAMTASMGFAQRFTDKIDRGLVAVPSSTSGNFVSWHIFGEEYYDVTYNLYCNGTKIAENLNVSCYNHSNGNASSKYQVAAVVKGVEQEKCAEVTRWNNGVLTIPVQKITGRDGTDVTSNYTINDIPLIFVRSGRRRHSRIHCQTPMQCCCRRFTEELLPRTRLL